MSCVLQRFGTELISSTSERMSLAIFFDFKGVETISPNGRMIATIYFGPFETSIPTAFINCHSLRLLMDLPVLLIAYSIYCGVTRMTYGDSTCIKRTLRMRSWLSVLIADAMSKKRDDIPIAPSLYSLSNKMDKSLLAVRDINHKYIVVEKGNKKAEHC